MTAFVAGYFILAGLFSGLVLLAALAVALWRRQGREDLGSVTPGCAYRLRIESGGHEVVYDERLRGRR